MQLTYRLFITHILIALLLAGCVAPQSPHGLRPDQHAPGHSPALQVELDRATELALTGDYIAAAAIYNSLAGQTPAPNRQDLQLLAISNYLLAQDGESAGQLLAQTNIDGLPPLFDLRKRMLTSQLAISQSRLQDALYLLADPPAEDTSTDLRQRYHRQRAQILRLAGNLLESARELGQLDLLVSDPVTKLHNQQAIIQTLAILTDGALKMLQPAPPGIQGGWMELARIIKGYAGEPENTQTQLNEWRRIFPLHPAMPTLLDGYYQRLKSQYRTVKHLAILLPRSGGLAEPAAALRDGFMAAYYQLPPAKRPQLRFYDSSNTADAWPLYRQAVDAGADMIIGPLQKDAVSQLARAGELDIPVLALNQTPPQTIPPKNLYQFGLSPEDEARQAAERAWLDGFTKALVITPYGSWGGRIANSFRDRWESLGGSMLENQSYDPKKLDFSKPVLTLLDIDESKTRRREIQRILRQNVKFKPRRRQDVDVVFFAAKPRAARQIRPLLQFHHAADLPVYTTSHVYSGIPDAEQDRDLEGVKFPDIPWLLANDEDDPLAQDTLAAFFPNAKLRYQRLYAMGIDGFNLLPHLERLRTSPWETLDGQTGNLYLDGINQVHRRLVWAQIQKGIPSILGYAPRIESDLNAPGEDLPFPLTPPSQVTPAAPVAPANTAPTDNDRT
ncbi:Penicillin-binding protein activator LpoA [hydrothermal vent metagenome]|uniref:Penicillin-binding protein activator LpoA n=1 Tax=hydrothermal vent metagenome TaxID=652676 RepID=A0A3B1B285_9ZZZZ